MLIQGRFIGKLRALHAWRTDSRRVIVFVAGSVEHRIARPDLARSVGRVEDDEAVRGQPCDPKPIGMHVLADNLHRRRLARTQARNSRLRDVLNQVALRCRFRIRGRAWRRVANACHAIPRTSPDHRRNVLGPAIRFRASDVRGERDSVYVPSFVARPA